MDTNTIRELITTDKLMEAVDELHAAITLFPNALRNEVIHQKARLERVEKDNREGLISREHFILERNIIRRDILGFIDSLEDISYSPREEGGTTVHASPTEEITALIRDYEEYKQIQNTFTRLRLVDHTSRKIAEWLALSPNLMDAYQLPLPEAMLVGIAKKIRNIPSPNDLDTLEKLTDQADSNFSRGNLVNALAEIIYTGQLRLGDDKRVLQMLDHLGMNADIPLQTNIERVRAALEYIT